MLLKHELLTSANKAVGTDSACLCCKTLQVCTPSPRTAEAAEPVAHLMMIIIVLTVQLSRGNTSGPSEGRRLRPIRHITMHFCGSPANLGTQAVQLQ